VEHVEPEIVIIFWMLAQIYKFKLLV